MVLSGEKTELPDNGNLLSEFSDMLDSDYSENTRDAYIRFVKPFLENNPSPPAMDRFEVGRFILEWRNRMSKNSLRLATSALIKFYRFLKFYHGYETADDVIDHIRDLKGEFFRTEPFQPDPLSDREIMTLNQYALGNSDRATRRRSILNVLMGTGLRVSEFCNLTRENVVLHQVGTPSHLFIPGGKTISARRKIPLHRDFEYVGQWILGERVVDALDQYLEVRPEPDSKESNEYFFISERGTPLSRRSVQSMISRLAEQADLQQERRKRSADPISVHNLRHTFATLLARTGASAYQIKSILGHASVTTSQAYIRLIERVG